ncbi:ABC-2 family transporter protein [Paenibacillus aurantius]|uniref:ABC-2 family transporter protein n=1 Tax=Paenibacillus aurantius TaxID=2918900 RepID=A0AA96LBK0_9BACL|nr:ABC-2 family transporter protein [Paenibacillus aurantius]WNQ10627.1 ABC-2 family transporter protein [Paenibacillus aurantius]
MDYFPLYGQFVKMKLKGMAQFRGPFWIITLSKASLWTVEVCLIWILVDRFQSIAGWGPYEVLLLYGLNLASYALAGFFFYHPFTYLPRRIQTGEFDEILTKPLNPFLYLLSREFSTGYFSNLGVALTVMMVCIRKLELSMDPGNLLFLVLTLLGGALIQASLFIFTSVPAFWMVQNNSLVSLVFDLKEFVRYPLTAYHWTIQILLTLVLPFAFINFYPAQHLLGKAGEGVLQPGVPLLTPLVGIVLFLGAYAFWKFGITRYRSTGS